jgi:hypothetical protein
MATFPMMKTGAQVQYPLETSSRFLTQSVEFLDGSRQSFSLQGRALRSWSIRLDLLDDQELSAVAGFVAQTCSGTFLFTDPVSGEASIKCILGADGFQTTSLEEMRGLATLVIREVL